MTYGGIAMLLGASSAVVALFLVQLMVAIILTTSRRAAPVEVVVRARALAVRAGLNPNRIRFRLWSLQKQLMLPNAITFSLCRSYSYIFFTPALLHLPANVVDAAVAHELGHIHARHTLHNLGRTWMAWTAIVSALIGMAMAHELWGLWLFLVVVAVFVPESRLHEQELEADEFAASLVGQEAIRHLLHTLTTLIDDKETDTHPDTLSRLRALDLLT